MALTSRASISYLLYHFTSMLKLLTMINNNYTFIENDFCLIDGLQGMRTGTPDSIGSTGSSTQPRPLPPQLQQQMQQPQQHPVVPQQGQDATYQHGESGYFSSREGLRTSECF